MGVGAAQLLSISLSISILSYTAAAPMAAPRSPPHNLPSSLRASDGPHTFTYDTVRRRLPMIVKSTIASNAYSAALQAELTALADEIERGAPLTALASAELARWNLHEPMARALAAGETWMSAPWFLVENYLYKRILQSVRAHGELADPFASQKRDALLASESALLTTILPLLGTADAPDGSGRPARAPLAHLLYRSLWGNRADLSISAGDGKAAVSFAAAAGAGRETGPGGAAWAARERGQPVPLEQVRDEAHLLVDDTARVLACLPARASPEGRVVLVLDNAGLELLTDLALAVALLQLGHCAQLELCAKDAPTFVSDATAHDVRSTVLWLAGHAHPGAQALAAAIAELEASGRLRVSAHEPFFTSPCSYWQMPDELAASWADASLVLLKGDANYRRLLGDAHWAHATEPRAVLGEGWPAARTLCLRTCKSEVLVGVPPAQTARAAQAQAAWLTGGEFGVVQLFER